MRNMLAVATSVLALALTALAGNPNDVNVFVTTAAPPNASGFVDPGDKQRADSTVDVRRFLVKITHVIDKPEDADVIVTIVDRGAVANGDSTLTRDWSGVHSRHDNSAVVVAELSAGDYKTTIVGSDSTGILPWRGAAGEVARQVRDWIKANHDKLIEQRKKP